MKRNVLHLTLLRDGQSYRIIATSGEVTVELNNVASSPEDIISDLYDLQEAVITDSALRSGARATPSTARLRPHLSRRGNPNASDLDQYTSPSEVMIHEIGTRLFNFLFQKRIFDLYNDYFHEVSKKDRDPLLLRLHITDPILSRLPWETMYDSSNKHYLALNHLTPFARIVEDHEEPMNSDPPIRILGLVAKVRMQEGIVLPEIDEGDIELDNIRTVLQPLTASGKARLGWVSSPTFRELNRRMANGDSNKLGGHGDSWDIFHFIGHGGLDEASGRGYVLLRAEGSNRGIKVHADNFTNGLIHPRGMKPKLVVLNSCSGAQGQPGNIFGSVAEALIQKGVPAVIAMQFEISDKMGAAFAAAFYAYLSDGNPISEALAMARAELRLHGYSEWIAPVLYLRPIDGLFEL